LVRSAAFSAALAITLLLAPAPRALAQISVQIGPAPVCPYGYFPYAPYNCAPWGYYGPEWFSNGIFIGAGPWFHGRRDWHGHVNDFYDPHHGYHGALPHRGERDQWQGGHWRGHPHQQFHGSQLRDGRGNMVRGGHSDHGGHPHGH
jgi:hypothetical protein